MLIKPDILATIHLYNTNEGGRKTPIINGYSCPVYFEKSYKASGYICKIYLQNLTNIHPGEVSNNVQVKFLNWDTVKHLITNNTRLYFREMQFVGELIVEKIFH